MSLPNPSKASNHGLPLIFIGGGGHCKVLQEIATLHGIEVLGFTDINKVELATNFLGYDDYIMTFSPRNITLAIGLGSTTPSPKRAQLFDKFKAQGFSFRTLIHPQAIVSSAAHIEEGAQIMAGAVIQANARIGANAILNTNCTIDHDCNIGDHAHIAPGATVCGNVYIGRNAHIGAGSIVIQNVNIGYDSLVAAGATVIESISNSSRVKGTPAKSF